MLEGMCKEVYNIQKKEYLYKLNDKGRFVKEMQGHRLVDRDLGSAVSTFRKEQTLKSKFPANFWRKRDF
jgi:hypothetical protein